MSSPRSTLAAFSTFLAVGTGTFLGVSLPESRAATPPSAEGSHVAVATEHADASRAALAILDRGGSAADAAIAAALVLGVVNPSASGIGGGGFALVYTKKTGAVTALDFRETAPERIDAARLGTRSKDWFELRGYATGVPGEPAGLEWLSTHHGKLSLADVAAPAVDLARRGFWTSRYEANAIGVFKDRIAKSPELANDLLPGGAPLGYAVRGTRKDLAKTLERFGREGKKPFYEGAFAEAIVRTSKANGGGLELSDLAGYAPKERAPLSRTVDGRTIVTMPAPSAGGLMLQEALAIYGASKDSVLTKAGFGSSETHHLLAEAMRGAIADRVRIAGDPDIDPNVQKAYETALLPGQMAARKARIDPKKTHAAAEFKTREQGTTHLVVVDAEGNVVTLTTTVNAGFGSGIVAGDTGILLNDQLTDFSTSQELEGFAVVGLGPNRPRAKARPVSSMTPTIVLENGAPILALGGSGGTRIATGTTQVAVCRLVFGLDPQVCVSAPRIHVSGAALVVDRDIPIDVREGLSARGEAPKEEEGATAMQAIAIERTSSGGTRLLAASDPRKMGYAVAR